MQTKTKGNIRLIIRIALVIVVAVVGIVIFWNRSVSADALATNTNKQVKISYYSGVYYQELGKNAVGKRIREWNP